MHGKIVSHEELDALLNEFALDPENFSAQARKLAKRFDRQRRDLEISDPQSWQRSAPESVDRPSTDSQLRADIDRFILIGREPEARLARRIQFARIRLELALETADLDFEDLNGGKGSLAASLPGRSKVNCEAFPKVCRRWTEWHTLRTELVERNLYLVLINVERYAHTTAGRADLIQEGSAALYRAVDGFDWKRGLLFRTYAVHWLNQAFRAYLYNFSKTVRVPVYLQKAMRHVNQAIEKLGDPDASPAEIAKITGLGENLVRTALESIRSTRSLDAPISSLDDGGGLRELLSSSEPGPDSLVSEDISLSEGIHQALDRLSDRERYVIEMRYGIDKDHEHTLAEVAGELGVSLERVRQIQMRAIGKLRNPALRKVVDPYLNN
ncbi:MAG: sigma-70 family RNA polymerase sigma factor [Planctomycetes bacterium]|nr:sigma-70 family RNA polymerase sigma factor [Planctomycetota bacterium]